MRAVVLGPPELMKIPCVGQRQTCCSQHVLCECVCECVRVFVLVEAYRKPGGTSYVSVSVLHMCLCEDSLSVRHFKSSENRSGRYVGTFWKV